jgi:hypothetical protein
MGAILAGVFTQGALTQLTSLGFQVLYFPYDLVVDVFRRFGIDASFDEDTSDASLQAKVDAYDRLSAPRKAALSEELLVANKAQVEAFVGNLSAAILRQVERIVILPLHGAETELSTVEEAVRFIEAYADGAGTSASVVRFEIHVLYTNGNTVDGRFKDKASAVEFLKTYHPASKAGAFPAHVERLAKAAERSPEGFGGKSARARRRE